MEEMDVAQENQDWNCTEDEFAEESLYPEALGISDGFRDPELLPRIGEQYQVEIPPLMAKSKYLCFRENLFPNTYEHFLMGLPISLMWIKDEVGNIKNEPKEFPGDLNSWPTGKELIKHEGIRDLHIFPKCELEVKTQPMDITLHGVTEVRVPANLDLQEERQTYMHQQHGGKDYFIVPGSAGGTWSGLEEASFLLGLYIFGKNLVQVKKFVDSKKMGDILSFYYGKFYRSESYNRWSECRKMRSRRCIYGQRIFTGSTQQELLSRLFLHVSEECQNTLTEVAKKFGEGNMLLEEYVFTLKSTVGLNALVEAVGIGKRKQDLTGMALEPLRSNQVAAVRPEIPVGKACSILTPLEIINFLTGGYRLSKARSNDIFWEAVWPRLLARGWHSEQTNDHGFPVGSRHSLVFLIPGVKKFSRRKLVKGNHYFDSVSDVLNKVASDPGLLELNIGEDKGCDDKEENGWANEKILDQGEFSDQQRHCYLKPRTPSRSKEVMKFTVVDTSLATGETNRVRELRSLAIELMNVSTSRSDSEESDEDPFQDTRNVSDSSANLCSDRNKTDILKSSKINEDKRDSSPDRANFEINALEHSSPIIGSNFTKKIPKEQKAGKYDDMRPTKSIKGHAIKKTKPGDMNFLAPVAKRRRRVAACNKAAKVCNKIDSMLRQDEVICTSSYPLMEEKVSSCLDPYQVKISSASSSSRGSPNITDECTLSLSSNSSVAEHTNENYQSRTLIDLNISFPQDAETEPLIMEMTERVHDQASEQPEDSGMLKTSTSICNSSYEQAPSMNSRRQSTRNRPLTTKALEALAFGFLSIKQKRRDREDYATGNSLSRPSRRARSRMRITENFAAGVIDSKGDEKANGVCKGNGNIFSIQG
ncbi:uncharacterized protein LOC8262422 isoform X2 [Ricinus communis]|uniref:uncharacterized protein LOC8262422 isoform X2 n=1 Tax=Ricinus communis TaxID=3988 RepID=UPI0007725330|nr:uncharacterized protein LOC8262422 isoform X2 [Ricinus communis]|eukprot:XP_015573398.1 uncharacterized protein LOC8262422 isoform X2 [Ricinus communis]